MSRTTPKTRDKLWIASARVWTMTFAWGMEIWIEMTYVDGLQASAKITPEAAQELLEGLQKVKNK